MVLFLIALQIILVVYHQLTTLVDLHPLNNVRSYIVKERLLEALLAGEYLNWWKHYFFQSSQEWLKTYNRIFKETIIVLPPIKNNPVPNFEHTILHSLTLVTTIVTYIYFFTR